MAYQMKRGSAPSFKDIGSSSVDESPNKFDTDAALGGATAGAKLGSMFGPWGTVIGGVAGGALGGFSDSFGGGNSMSEEQMASLEPGRENRNETTKEKIARLKEQNIKKKVDQEVNQEMAASASETA